MLASIALAALSAATRSEIRTEKSHLWPVLAALVSLTLLATLLNAAFYLGPLRVLAKAFNKKQPDVSTVAGRNPSAMSVLMAARNEAVNLRQNMPALLGQDYPKLEYVLVDDDSEDETHDVLQEMASSERANATSIKLLRIKGKRQAGKKEALASAIAASTSDWLLFTDADCAPASQAWAQLMMAAREESTEIVLGYSPYRPAAGWLNRWIRFEAFYTALQYLTAALLRRPYMGVGRNLLYHKKLYARAGGFSAHEHLAGGDDDLLINAAANAHNTQICIDPAAWVWTQCHTSWSGYLRQKRRHLSVSPEYKSRDKAWLGLLAASHGAHYIGVLCLLVLGSWPWAIGIYLLRQMLLSYRLRQLARSMGLADLVAMLPILDAGLTLFYVYSALTLVSKTPNNSRGWA